MLKILTPLLAGALLLAGCAAPASPEPVRTPFPPPPTAAPADSTPSLPVDTREDAHISLRIVDGAESGELVLADPAGGEIYTQTVGDIPVWLDGEQADASALRDGMLAELTFQGNVLETWPARLSGVSAISVHSLGTPENPGGTTYDLCGLYLQVLEDLWEKDVGLNGGIEYVSVDLSDAPGELSAGEKAAVGWIFACRHGVTALGLTYEELREQGYLTQREGDPLPWWENGVLFSITADDWDEGEVYSLPVVKFSASKWRSGLGAYFLGRCKAVWPEMGAWSGYTVGAEAIA